MSAPAMSEAMKLKAATLTIAQLRENEGHARLAADYWLGVLHERTAGDYSEASVEGIRLAYQNWRDAMKFVALHNKRRPRITLGPRPEGATAAGDVNDPEWDED